jgi:type IV pilus assembly protein PilC
MATSPRPGRPAAQRPAARRDPAPPDALFEWEARDKSGRTVRGETRAAGEALLQATLRRQGLVVTRLRKRRGSGGGAIKQKDIAVFTRQLSAMMAAGVPLLQAFDIVARGSPNARMVRLLGEIRADVEAGNSLSAAFRKHPRQFDTLYCNLVEAGENAGILEPLLDRLATYQQKMLAIKTKVRSALMYPAAVIAVAVVVLVVIMVYVIPSFKDVFKSFGAELPAPTLAVIAMSDLFVAHGPLLLAAVVAGGLLFVQSWRRSPRMQAATDRLLLRLPLFGELVRKSVVARWTRTLATMTAAGVTLVESLGSVGGAAGNAVYAQATEAIQREVSTGTSLTSAMRGTGVFPPMVLQMAAIGEESGSLEHMLGKAAEIFEDEVDEMVKGLSSLLEPVIIVFLGTLVGGIVVSMYLPIFRLGSVV